MQLVEFNTAGGRRRGELVRQNTKTVHIKSLATGKIIKRRKIRDQVTKVR